MRLKLIIAFCVYSLSLWAQSNEAKYLSLQEGLSSQQVIDVVTSKSPLGPITIEENNLVIQKDPTLGIYGTGHNSVLQIPGKDEWYIVYHRFNYPNGIHMGDAAGFNREVCMDPMFFDETGRIIPVKPTH